MNTSIPKCWILAFGPFAASGAGFQNVDFNTPDLTHVHTDPITHVDKGPVIELLAGWNVFTGDEGEPFLGEINLSPGGPLLALNPSRFDFERLNFGPYYVAVAMFTNPGSPEPLLRPTLVLSQSGVVPVDSSRLEFYSTGASFTDVKVSISGQEQVITGGPAWKSVSVERFAGQSATIEFLFPKPEKGDGAYLFDVRGFAAIPEPQTVALTGLGIGAIALLLNWTQRRR